MIYYVNAKVKRSGDGSEIHPFKFISEAAALAHAGDEVLVYPGVYRESVNPKYAGTASKPIVYRSVEKKQAIITGAERICDWVPFDGDVWCVKIANGIFGDYNPYTTEIFGDWYFGKNTHTGEVYLNGKSMYEVASLDEVLKPQVASQSWDHEFSLYKWFTKQEDGFTLIYANFHGSNPNVENVEINVRRTCFYPSVTGINYIHLKGFSINKAATQWAPPTAYQEGMVGPHWSKGWLIEDCEIADSKCVGICLGKYLQPNNENKWFIDRVKHGTQTERDAICQAQIEGWNEDNVGSHIIRRCDIHNCEQAGIVGHLGCVFSLIEDNHIHHINNKQQLNGAEIGGIKLHAAIDTTIRRNHIHHCTRGLWLDWQAQGTRVSQNLMHDNHTPQGTLIHQELALGEDIFIEVSHGPTLVDNNILLSDFSIRFATQGVALIHNIIAGPFTEVGRGTNNSKTDERRYTPYHVPHRTEVAGFMTFLHGDNRFYNNIFIGRKAKAEHLEAAARLGFKIDYDTGISQFDAYPNEEEFKKLFFVEGDGGLTENRQKYYLHLPIYAAGNVYCNGAKPWAKEQNFKLVTENIELSLKEEDGKYFLNTNLYEHLPKFAIEIQSSTTLGKAFEPEQRYENHDGSEIIFNKDYFDEHRSLNPLAGPFVSALEVKEELF